MRFLITCVSGISHFHSMVPVAAAARRRGHEVTFATAAEMSSLVGAAGFSLAACGPSRLRIRTELERVRAGRGDAGPTQSEPGYLFGAVIPRLRLGQLQNIIRSIAPDVVISEALDLAGPLAAQLSGVPYFVQSIGPFHASTAAELLDAFEPLYRQETGQAVTLSKITEPYIDICPPALQSQPARGFRHSLPVMLPTYHGSRIPVEAAGTVRTDNRRVLISFGTVSNDALDDYHLVTQTLADQGWTVTLTVGPRGWFDWTTRPDAGDRRDGGVRLVDYIPLDAELPGTAVLIHHGGSNTLRAAIEHAVPALVIPQGTEQGRNAQWIDDHGLGVMLQPAEVTPAEVSAVCAQLTSDDAIRQRLEAARDAWRAMPSDETLIKAIEAMASDRL